MKKQVLSILLALSMACFLLPAASFAEEGTTPEEISVYIDQQLIQFDVPPMRVRDRTMVPLRKIAESLGAKVDWSEELQQITITKGNIVNKLTIGDTTAVREENGETVTSTLDAAPFTQDDRTLVPLRYLSEGFGLNVEWVEETHCVLITTPPSATPAPTAAPEFAKPGSDFGLITNKSKPLLLFDGDHAAQQIQAQIKVRQEFELVLLKKAVLSHQDDFINALKGGTATFRQILEPIWEEAIASVGADKEENKLDFDTCYEAAVAYRDGDYVGVLDASILSDDLSDYTSCSLYVSVVYSEDRPGASYVVCEKKSGELGYAMRGVNHRGDILTNKVSIAELNRDLFAFTSIVVVGMSYLPK